MQAQNPATGDVVATYDEHTPDDVDSLLEQARHASNQWQERDIVEREELLAQAADVLRENEDRYAELMTEEMGKPITQAHAEVEKCAWVCEYYAERAAEQLQDETIGGETGAETSVIYQPLGPVLAIMPWNFPFWQVFRFAAPNITAGNVGLLKHASNVPGCALAIQEVFEEAGYPEGVFTSLLIGSDRVDDVISDDRIRAVTLTGSDRAGRAVAEAAAPQLKKTVLELGGSDAFIVLPDAPLDETCRMAAQARNINSGQSCIAAKRFIVHEDIYHDFLDGFTDEMQRLQVGDPMDSETDIGPQARMDLMETLHEQVQQSVDGGADVHLGGEPLDREGSFYPPTILTDVPTDTPVATEEVFGPVAPVFTVENEDQAIELANSSHLGLGASVWTDDLKHGEHIARRLEAGATFVNEFVKSDPRLPFGGVKDSGYGRELSRHGIREFVNRKTLWIQQGVGDDEALVE
jgi:succinate-semialdehyde dehydrogenase/glutarate-semialdehyde dehydrogenase